MKKIKKFKEKRVDVGVEIRRLGVLVEDVNDGVKLLAEQYGSITEMVGKLAMNMEIVKSDTEFIKGGLRKKIDVDEFAALEHRVATLESKSLR